MAPPLIHWDDVEPRSIEIGHLRADWSFLGPAAGCVEIGVRRIRIEPGWFSTPLHVHASDEETFFVLEGSGLSLQDDRAYEVRAGDCIVHREAAEAHTLNAGDDGLDVLALGVSRESGTGARLPRAGVFWNARAWYEIAGGKSPFEREADAGAPDVPAPGERPATIVNVDEATDEIRDREGHRGSWRRLGREAGATRTNLNHIVLEPGQMGAPPHCHGAEEELFVVLDGGGELLLGDDGHPLRPGNIVARPAGTGVAHAFTAGEQGLTLLAYGPREPNDIVYYPRSNKIFFAGVDVVTRVEKIDYWDGED